MSTSPEYKYVAYIDEAGDPGLTRVLPRHPNGSSEWIVIAGVLIPEAEESNVSQWIADLRFAMNSHQMRDIHFQKLNDTRKTLACTFVAERNVRIFVVLSNKQNMEGYVNPRAARTPSDNWFYCWLTRILLERITHDVYHASIKRYGEPKKVKLEFSERGGLSYSQMNAYYEWLKLRSASGKYAQFIPFGDFEYGTLHRDLMRVYNHRERDGLKLPDIVASAFFKAVDVHQTRGCDATYAKWLTPKLARSPGDRLIAGYGVKLLPSWKALGAAGVSEEQRAILKHCGYPGPQWWQKVVEPGPV